MYQISAKPQTLAKKATITPVGVLSGISIGWYAGSGSNLVRSIASCLRCQ